MEKSNVYCIIGELESQKALQDHFRARNFEVLLGAVRTLGEDLKMNILEMRDSGGFELARSLLDRKR